MVISAVVITFQSLSELARVHIVMLYHPGNCIEQIDAGENCIESFSEKHIAIAANSIPNSQPRERTVKCEHTVV